MENKIQTWESHGKQKFGRKSWSFELKKIFFTFPVCDINARPGPVILAPGEYTVLATGPAGRVYIYVMRIKFDIF